jgi:threonine synthase
MSLAPSVVSILIQHCHECGRTFAETDPRLACECGGLLDLQHSTPPPQDATRLRSAFADRVTLAGDWRGSGVWRYRELVLPTIRDDQIVSHPEGNTPLIANAAVSRFSDANLLLKHEGHNPTGSFKDRGMTVGVSHAKRIGATTVACASTGNTSASLAAYAALADLSAVVFVPAAHVSASKLTQALAYGARTLVVRGDFDACLQLARAAAEKLGVYLLNSINPFRLEGQKTIVFELLQQLDWRAPDWIALPAGNLGNTAAFGKALREARDLGLIDHLPRLAAIQAAGAAPFATAFRANFAERIRVDAHTVASAIRIGAPASWDRAVRAIRETDGIAIAVTDDDILDAKAVIDAAGIGCEPASAASVAGVRHLVRDRVIRPEESVVALLTGHLLKDTATPATPATPASSASPRAQAPHSNDPIEIAPDLRDVERVLYHLA